MKAPVANEEQFITDAKGKRTGVLITLDAYERLREAEEELADIQAYDALRDRAHAEIAAGQFESLTSYRASRKRNPRGGARHSCRFNARASARIKTFQRPRQSAR